MSNNQRKKLAAVQYNFNLDHEAAFRIERDIESERRAALPDSERAVELKAYKRGVRSQFMAMAALGMMSLPETVRLDPPKYKGY